MVQTQIEPKIIFEDEYLLVLEKPAGLVTTSSETQKIASLEDILRDKYKIKADRGGIVHRLDKDTSGLLVVGKSDEMVLKLQAQFKERLVKKEYLALCHGRITTAGRIEASIARNPENREKFTVGEDLAGAREAVTEYEPLKNLQFTIYNLQKVFSDFNKIQMRKLEKQRYGEFTLLRCKPKTGRTHQIRVHLKHIGHPIIADEKYGGRKIVRLDKRWCERQFLHAEILQFNHPVTEKMMRFESKLPADLQQALTFLQNE